MAQVSPSKKRPSSQSMRVLVSGALRLFVRALALRHLLCTSCTSWAQSPPPPTSPSTVARLPRAHPESAAGPLLSEPTEIPPPPYRETSVAVPLLHCVSCSIADYRCYAPHFFPFLKKGLSQSKDRPKKGGIAEKACL